MANKKGEGVRGVLGDLVSKEKERQEHSRQPAHIASPPSSPDHTGQTETATQAANTVEPPEAASYPVNPAKKAAGIKGRPRGRKADTPDAQRERTKITLSIDEVLRDQFYRLAYSEMIQPGEFVERALRYYIKHHQQ